MTGKVDAPFTSFYDVAASLGKTAGEANQIYAASTLALPKYKLSSETILTEQEVSTIFAHLGVRVPDAMSKLKERLADNADVHIDAVRDTMRDLKYIRVLVSELQSGDAGYISGDKYREYAIRIMQLLGVHSSSIVPLANAIKKEWDNTRRSVDATRASEAVVAFDEDEFDDDKDFF